ncbi:MAG: alpha/beta fold hydrolase [Chloroflexota bacterium]
MPFAENAGVRIHYSTEGQGPPLVLQHGFANSAGVWRRLGYVEALKAEYQLILVDARGHGASDRLHDPAAYELGSFVGDVCAVLDELGITRAHFFGYSMGAWIGYGLARLAPRRLLSLIAGGHHPDGSDFRLFQGLDGRDPVAFLQAIEAMIGEPLAPRLRQAMLANDLVALAALVQPRASQAVLLAPVDVPCLLFAGTADRRYCGIAHCAQRLPQALFVPLEGLNHVQAIARSDLIVPAVRAFMARSAPPREP